MFPRLQDLFRRSLFQNVIALYGAHFARYIFPLITVPYLARVLGPEAWGLVSFAQSTGQYLSMIVEYGFNLSATREVARARDSIERRSRLVAGVMGAKALLAVILTMCALFAAVLVPVFQEDPITMWMGVFAGLAAAFNVKWYFQGVERMGLVAVLDVATKAFSLVGLFVWVKAPSDRWVVLAISGAASTVSNLIAFGLAYREVPIRLPRWRDILEALKLGWASFLFQSTVSLYTTGNVFILGLLASPEVVGYFSGAEKISKAVLGLLSPLSQAVYPRVSHLIQRSKLEAARLARVSLVLMGVGGVLLGSVIYLSAPLLVHALLGTAYDPAIGAVRILAAVPPLIALSNVLGIQWMLPLGLDRLVNKVIVSAGVVNLILALSLVGHFGHLGMAWSVVASEAFVTCSMFTLLRRRAMDPITLWKQEWKRRLLE